MSREYTIGEVLTVTTGTMLSEHGMDGVYDILNYMTGDDLYTHQLPRALRECKPYILRAYPELADIQVPELDGSYENMRAWLATLPWQTLAIDPIPQDDHTFKDPLAELQEMADKPVMVIHTD